METKIDIIDLYQGQGANGLPFGYVGMTEQGGYFFDWLNTLDETLDSMEADEIDPPHFDFRNSAIDALRKRIGNEFERLHIAAHGEYPFQLCK